MFRKLHIQFIAINLALIAAVFAVVSAGSYWLLRQHLVERAGLMASRFVQDAERGHWPPPPSGEQEGPPPLPMKMFVGRTDGGGHILMQAPVRAPELPEAGSLAALVAGSGVPSGLVEYEGVEYYYARRDTAAHDGFLMAIQSFEEDNQLLQQLMLALGLTGLTCMGLLLGGNLFWGRKAMAPVRRAWQQQREFLADASHELRTPLTVLSTNLSLVRSQPEETVHSQQRWLDNIQAEVQQMSELVDNLLFLARSDARQQVLEKKQLRLEETVASVVDAFRPAVQDKGVQLRLRCPAEVILHGDELRLRQVLNNLLDNALRHTPVGGSIEVLLERAAGRVCLRVSDTGEGIAAACLPNIFERFYQADQSRSRGKSGLGLAIVQSIVENHGGKISVESQLGQGTHFLIELPLRAQEV